MSIPTRIYFANNSVAIIKTINVQDDLCPDYKLL